MLKEQKKKEMEKDRNLLIDINKAKMIREA